MYVETSHRQTMRCQLITASTSLAAWQAFFDATDGTAWKGCSANRDSPCSCYAALKTHAVNVECAQDTIQSIAMQANHLTGAFPVSA